MTTTETEKGDALACWLKDDVASGRRAERFARQADTLERLLPKGSRDNHGNSVETVVSEMRRVAAKGCDPQALP